MKIHLSQKTPWKAPFNENFLCRDHLFLAEGVAWLFIPQSALKVGNTTTQGGTDRSTLLPDRLPCMPLVQINNRPRPQFWWQDICPLEDPLGTRKPGFTRNSPTKLYDFLAWNITVPFHRGNFVATLLLSVDEKGAHSKMRSHIKNGGRQGWHFKLFVKVGQFFVQWNKTTWFFILKLKITCQGVKKIQEAVI